MFRADAVREHGALVPRRWIFGVAFVVFEYAMDVGARVEIVAGRYLCCRLMSQRGPWDEDETPDSVGRVTLRATESTALRVTEST